MPNTQPHPIHLRRRTFGLAALLIAGTLAAGLALEHQSLARWGRSFRVPTVEKPGCPVMPPPALAPCGSSSQVNSDPGLPVTISTRLDRSSVTQGSNGLVRMEVVLKAGVREGRRLDSDLVVVLDRSGSMAGAKLECARAAIAELVGQMTESDRFALVTYADNCETVIPLAAATFQARMAWLGLIDQVAPGGTTDISAGLEAGNALIAASRQDGRMPRMILISDGHANRGDTTQAGLIRRAGQAMAGEYAMSTIGVGDGFNEHLMTALADAGTGNYYYLKDALALGSVFQREFTACRTTLARALSVTLTPPAGWTVAKAAGFPLVAEGGSWTFRPGHLTSGQERRVWVTLHCPTASPAQLPVGIVQLTCTAEGRPVVCTLADNGTISVVADEAVARASLDKSAWEQSLVQEEYNDVREQVATLVAQGKKDETRKVLADYVMRNTLINDTVQSATVDDNLKEVADLSRQVEQVFNAPVETQDRESNAFSKSVGAQSYKDRRAQGQ